MAKYTLLNILFNETKEKKKIKSLLPEIIYFGSITIDSETGDYLYEHNTYVKPKFFPKLEKDFILDANIDEIEYSKAPNLHKAMEMAAGWMKDTEVLVWNGGMQKELSQICHSYGLKSRLRKKIFHCMKTEFAYFYSKNNTANTVPMEQALAILGETPEKFGQKAKKELGNLIKITQKMIQTGWQLNNEEETE